MIKLTSGAFVVYYSISEHAEYFKEIVLKVWFVSFLSGSSLPPLDIKKCFVAEYIDF